MSIVIVRVCPHQLSADDINVDSHQLAFSAPARRCQPAKTSIRTIVWRPPPFQWMKVNTDGASKGNPGPASCGAVFRDFQGNFRGGFSMNLGVRDSFFAEVAAIIISVELASQKGWNHLWLESDSTSAINSLGYESFDRHPELKTKWLSCKSKIEKMNFHCSHIFREGNAAADFLANMGQLCSSFTWWDRPPHVHLQQLLLEDKYGFPKYRVR